MLFRAGRKPPRRTNSRGDAVAASDDVRGADNAHTLSTRKSPSPPPHQLLLLGYILYRPTGPTQFLGNTHVCPPLTPSPAPDNIYNHEALPESSAGRCSLRGYISHRRAYFPVLWIQIHRIWIRIHNFDPIWICIYVIRLTPYPSILSYCTSGCVLLMYRADPDPKSS